MKCTAQIQAGVCGFATQVTADSPDDQMVMDETVDIKRKEEPFWAM